MLKRVTFSGIDSQTKVQDLKKLYEKYPFVEFVFLYSQQANQKGQGRYPRTVILKGYKKAGLPPTAIANPGLESIQAALQPEVTEYYYYALGKDGQHRFFTNYSDHVNFINSSEYVGN